MKLTPAQRHLSKADPVIAGLIKKYAVRSVGKTSNLFAHLVSAIVSQQISTKAASSIMTKFKKFYAPKRFPSPAEVTATPVAKLRTLGLSGRKAEYVKDLAKHFVSESPTPKKLSNLSDEEIISQLTEIRGVGRWTVEMLLIFALGREDVFSHGDYGLLKAVQKNYGFKQLPARKTVERLAKQWAPHRSTACLLLWESLDNTNSK